MTLLKEIELLKTKLNELYLHYDTFTHDCVVSMSQALDRKLNEYDQFQRSRKA